MAIRLFSKINSTFNSNLTQVFHPRSLVKSAASCINNDKAEKEKSSNDEETIKTPLLHENIKHKTFNVRDRSQLSFPDLQPCTLAEYYNPHPNFDNPLKYIEKTATESNKSASQRVFEASTTYKNVKLPLKQPRLAKPFPDPVKMMASDTISDDEKARQMQSDAQYPGNSKSKNLNKINFNPQYRSFSCKCRKSKKRKCKKKKKNKCEKMRCRHCPPVRGAHEHSYKFKRCRKQKAPYPSYSEICHTVLDSNPTECQMCPWTPQNHPTFKIKKRDYHKSAITFSPKEKDFEKWLHSVDQNRGWVREKKTLQKDEKKSSEINKNIEIPKSTNQFKLHHSERFSNTSKNKKSNVEIRDPIIVQQHPSTLNISSKPFFLYPEIKTEKDEVIKKENLKKNGKRRSKKEMLPAVKHKSKAKNVLYNPEKKKQKVDQDWYKEEIPSTINITINYFMAKKKKDRRLPPGTRDKCPDVETEGEDPCGLKRPGKTRECPKDLLIKKRRPIKPPGKKKCYTNNPQKPKNSDQPYF